MIDTTTPVEDYFSDVRAINSLRRNGYFTIADVLQASGRELLRMANFGIGSLHHVQIRLAVDGLRLADDCPLCGAHAEHQRR